MVKSQNHSKVLFKYLLIRQVVTNLLLINKFNKSRVEI